jgi:hypothetical protein
LASVDIRDPMKILFTNEIEDDLADPIAATGKI